MISNVSGNRCGRCGRVVEARDKFCAECGLFLRDKDIDQRLLLALAAQQHGRADEARQELERLLDSEPDHALANHLLGRYLLDEAPGRARILHQKVRQRRYVRGHLRRQYLRGGFIGQNSRNKVEGAFHGSRY